MAEYFGLRAIAQRLGIKQKTVVDWFHRDRFLMYKRRAPGPRTPGEQTLWYTNDQLILAWQQARAAKEWDRQRNAKARARVKSTLAFTQTQERTQPLKFHGAAVVADQPENPESVHHEILYESTACGS